MRIVVVGAPYPTATASANRYGSGYRELRFDIGTRYEIETARPSS